MFRGLLDNAKSAVTGLVLKYVARGSVAIPFVIAFGFALAAITAMLVERFGTVLAYWAIAAGLTVIGIVAVLAVSMKEHEEERKEERGVAGDTSDLAAEVAAQVPLALIGSLLSLPGGTETTFKAAKIAGRNWPLVVLVGVVALLFWPTSARAAERVQMTNGKARSAVWPSP
jgi:hypothetical protein